MALTGNEIAILIKARDDASAAMDRVQGKAGKLGGMLGKVLKVGALAGGAALAGVGVTALKMGMDFEKSMAEVKTLMPDISEKAFGKLRDDVLAFSKEMGIATDKAVPALYQAISAGVPRENVMDFMKVASKAAIGGVTELETAVDGVTSVVNAYGAETINAQKAADIMFTGVKLGKTTFDQLSSSLFNVVPIAAASGVSFQQVTAALAALTAQGVPTATATTQLRAAIQALSAPTVRQKKLMEELGLEFSAARLEQIGLSAAFKEAIEATGGNMEQLRKLIGSVEGLQAVLALGGEQSYKFDEALLAMGDSAGAVDAAFDTMAETTSFKLNKAINEIKVIMTEMAIRVLPVLVEAFEKGSKALKEWWAEHGPKVKDMLGDLRDLLDDVRRAVIPFVEEFVSGSREILTHLRNLANFIYENKPLMIAAILAIGAAIVTAFGPYSLAVAAIIGLIGAIGALADAWDTLPLSMRLAIGAMMGIPGIAMVIKDEFEATGGAIRQVEDPLKEVGIRIESTAQRAARLAAPVANLTQETDRMRRTFIDTKKPIADVDAGLIDIGGLGGTGGSAGGAGGAMDKAADSALSLEAAMALANSMMDKAITTQQDLSRGIRILIGTEIELEDLLRIQIGVLEDQLTALDAAGEGQNTLAEATRGAIQILEDQAAALESGEERLILFGDAIGPVSAALQDMNDAISEQIDLVKGLLSVQTEEEAQLEAEASRLKYEIELIDQVAGATRGLSDFEKQLLSAAQSRVRSREDELEVTKEIIEALEEKRKAGEDLDWQEKKELTRSKERRDELDALIEKDKALIEKLEGLREAVTLEGKAAQGQTDILEEQLAVIEDAIEDIEAEKKARVDELGAMVQGRPTMEEWTRAIYDQAVETGLLSGVIKDVPPLLRKWWEANFTMSFEVARTQNRLLLAQRTFTTESMGLAGDWANAWTGAASDIAAAMAGAANGQVAAAGVAATPALAAPGAAGSVSGGGVHYHIEPRIGEHGIYTMDRRQREEIVRQIIYDIRRELR